MAVKMPIIASDTTITSRSIVSHWGMRFAGCWIIACALRDPYSVTEVASGSERVHIVLGIDWDRRRATTAAATDPTDPTLNDRLDDLVFAG